MIVPIAFAQVLGQKREAVKNIAEQLVKKYQNVANIPTNEIKSILIRWIAYNYFVPFNSSLEGIEKALKLDRRIISNIADSLVDEGIFEKVYNGKFSYYRLVDLEKAIKLDYVHFTFEEMKTLLISHLPFFANFDGFIPSERTLRSFPKLPGYPPGFEATVPVFMYPQEVQWLVLQYLEEGASGDLIEKIERLSKKNAEIGLPSITLKDIASFASRIKSWKEEIAMSGGLVLEYLPILGFTLPPTSFEQQYLEFAVKVTDKWKERGDLPTSVRVTKLAHLPIATHGSLIGRDILIHSSDDTLSTKNAYQIAKNLAENQLKVYIKWFEQVLSDTQSGELKSELIEEGIYTYLVIFRYATMYALFLGVDSTVVDRALKINDLIEKNLIKKKIKQVE